MRNRLFIALSMAVMVFSCAKSRIKEHAEWGKYYDKYGIKKACFIMRDNNHESIQYYNKDRCTERLCPASTFKILLSLVALETAVAPDDQLVIKWDSVNRKPEWDKDMNLREALTTSSEPYFKELARRIGPVRLQHFMDTIKYGNMKMTGDVGDVWTNNSIQISADEQTGFLKRLYFGELPVSERSQRIVKTMMLREETPGYNLYYKTGTCNVNGKTIRWTTGFCERIEHQKEQSGSMNKTDVRNYPYFFAQNFELPDGDTTKDWSKVRLDILHELLKEYGAIAN